MWVRDFRMVAALGVALIAGSVHAGEAPATGVSQTSRPSPTAAPPLTAATPPQAPATKLREPDVIYVPTPQNVVDAMLKMANVTAKDVVYDLGSGDGRIPITAAEKYGARGVGMFAVVSVPLLPPLLRRHTSVDTPSEPAMSTASLWYSVVCWPMAFTYPHAL